MKNKRLILAIACMACVSACAPEVGSDAWCESLAKKSKSDWTVNEATEFVKSCIIKTYDGE